MCWLLPFLCKNDRAELIHFNVIFGIVLFLLSEAKVHANYPCCQLTNSGDICESVTLWVWPIWFMWRTALGLFNSQWHERKLRGIYDKQIELSIKRNHWCKQYCRDPVLRHYQKKNKIKVRIQICSTGSFHLQNSDCAIMVLGLDWQNGSYHKWCPFTLMELCP